MMTLGERRALRLRERRLRNEIAALLFTLGAALVVLPLVLVLSYLIRQGLSAITLDFFTQLPAPPGMTGGGVAQALVGTGILLVIASLVGMTFGLGAGMFLAELPHHPLAPLVRLMSDVLLGVPAIVMGLVAYGLMVTTLGHFSAWSGGIALGFIMIPYMVRGTEEALKLVPNGVREAAYALGLPQWRVLVFVVLPSAAGGIITGAMLALARIAGEAAPLLFTAFGNQFWNVDPANPVAALPLVIYHYSISPYESWHQLAAASSLLLVVLVFLATLLTRLAFQRRSW